MIDLGKASAYIALFSEIGLVLFVCALGGALLGRWADQQFGTAPVVGLVGFLTGIALGAVADGLIMLRFLRRFIDRQ